MKKRLLAGILTLAMLLSLCACGSFSAPWNSGDKDTAQETESAEESEAPKEPSVYEVRFEMNGGTLVSGQLLQRIEEGGAAEAPEVQRTGYAFDGWDSSFDAVTENMVVAAQWTPTSRISFDPAGGSVTEGEIEQRVREGEDPVPPELTRKGSEFLGWSPELAPAAEDTVYVAQWTAQKLSSEEIYAQISPAVVEIMADEPGGEYYHLGSGFFIDDQGTFVTNYHVIDGTVSGEITLQDGTAVDIVAVKDYDEALDLAVLQANISGNEYLTISERDVVTGETVYAIGSSQGLTGTFSDGIVSTASRDMEGVQCIQITAPISEGNSGGPLVNIYGEVVGINSMSLIEGQNLNFAIDVDELQKLDHAGSITLQELYDTMYPAEETTISEGEGFYGEADAVELEPNGSLLLADPIENSAWIAGEISNVEDLDWFSFNLDAPCDVFFEVAPYYKSDMDYLLCGILEITDNGVDVKEVLMPENGGDYEVAYTGTIHFDTAGLYFLMVAVEDEYTYDEPVYYTARAIW